MIPNFLIIGAQKAGTTSLLKYLSKHRDIFVPKDKEVSKFYSHAKPRFKDFKYEHHFADWKGERYAGNAPVNILYFSHITSKNIYSFNPEMKLIAILRNPIDRAYSAYWHFVRVGLETETFESALIREKKIINKGTFLQKFNFTYMSHGFYYQQLVPFFDIFNREQILILLYDDFNADPRNTLKGVYDFLGIEESFPVNILRKRYNISSKTKFQAIHNLVYRDNIIKRIYKRFFPGRLQHKLRFSLIHEILEKNLIPYTYPPMKESTRNYLKEQFEVPNLELQEFIGRDLSGWNK